MTACRACPRLVAWREQVALDKRAAFRDEEYWGRPVPGFGDPAARVVLVGLAPAAHGANRTGRMFTGDRSGDFLYAALWRTGFANQPTSVGRDDGLALDGAWITAPVRCAPPANKPTPAERDRCRPFLERELALLGDLRVFVALGQFGYQVLCGVLGAGAPPAVRPRRRGEPARRPHGARQLPRQPAEHVHRPAHRADARRASSCGPAPLAGLPAVRVLRGASRHGGGTPD